MIWFGAAVVVEILLLLLNRYYLNYRVAEIGLAKGLDSVLHAAVYVGAAGLLAGILWAVKSRRDGKQSLAPVVVTAVCGVLGVCAFLVRHYGEKGMQVLQVAVPVCAVLILIYYLYKEEFFWVAVLSGLNIFGLWVYRQANDAHRGTLFLCLTLLAVAVAASLLLARKLQATGGVLTLGGTEKRLLSRKANYALIYATCGLAAVTMIAALVFGATAAYYAIFVVVAWAFVMAVYHTVRLM